MWAMPHLAASSILSLPEGRAALATARRAERLTRSAHGRAREQLESVYGELLLIGIDLPLARRAGELAEEFALRGYDAVHLASALTVDTATTLATWDVDLRRAALQTGCGVAPAADG
jgi:predicted nucleic acid-binding protein